MVNLLLMAEENEPRVTTKIAPAIHARVKRVLADRRGVRLSDVVDEALLEWLDEAETLKAQKGAK